MKKGFTLIELLAVIVILAIIALIATPIILNIISSAKSESDKRSKELYLDAVKQAIARKNLTEEFNPTECTVQKDGNLLCGEENLLIDINGTKPCSGEITFDEKGKITKETVGYCTSSDDSGDTDDEPAVPPTPKTFAEDDWSTIIANVQAGNIAAYNVGDEKTIELTGEVAGTYTVRVANTSTPSECKSADFSQTACGFVIEFKDIVAMKKSNSTMTNEGGYPTSEMRTYINDTIFNALPIELQTAIIETKAISGHGQNDSDNFISNDKLYLLSAHEVWKDSTSTSLYDNVSNFDTAYSNTRQLDYYEAQGVIVDSGDSAIKNYQGKASNWWLRTARSDNGYIFLTVNSSGIWLFYGATTGSGGVSPAFRLSD